MRRFKCQWIIAWNLNAPPTKDRAHDANTAKALHKKEQKKSLQYSYKAAMVEETQ